MKTMLCQLCGKECERTSNVQKYCPECRMKKQAERNSTYLKKKKEDVIGVGEEAVCANCGKPFVKKSGSQIYCGECGSLHQRTVRRYAAMTEEQKQARVERTDALYDRLSLYLPKGKKAQVQALAKKLGVSVNVLVNAAIEQFEQQVQTELENEKPKE